MGEIATSSIQSIQTSRLILRPIELRDAPTVFAYCSDGEVARYTNWAAHESIDDSIRFIRDIAIPSYTRGIPTPFGIALSDSPSTLIGTMGIDWTDRKSRCLELGYVLARPYWGRGLATEAGLATLAWAFSNAQPERIQARCIVENIPSARLMERLGMRHEGTLRSSVMHRGRLADVHFYSILRAEWALQPHPGADDVGGDERRG